MKSATLLAKGIVYLMGLGGLALCLGLMPELVREELVVHPSTFYVVSPFVIGLYAMAVPFFVALYQALRLLDAMGQGKAFAPASVNALCAIKYCAAIVAVLIVATTAVGVSFLRHFNPTEDMPPIVMLGTIATLASSVIATFAAVLQRLMQDAITIKSENDLTV